MGTIGRADAISSTHLPFLKLRGLLKLFRARNTLLSARLLSHRHSIIGRRDLRAIGLRIYLRKLSTKEKNLGRVIHPQQQRHKRAGRAIGGSCARLPEIPAEGSFAKREQQRSYKRADPYITPLYLGIWQVFVDQGEQQCCYAEGGREINRLPNQALIRLVASHHAAKRAQCSADRQRD